MTRKRNPYITLNYIPFKRTTIENTVLISNLSSPVMVLNRPLRAPPGAMHPLDCPGDAPFSPRSHWHAWSKVPKLTRFALSPLPRPLLCLAPRAIASPRWAPRRHRLSSRRYPRPSSPSRFPAFPFSLFVSCGTAPPPARSPTRGETPRVPERACTLP